ncbi:hypothetical protein K1T71_005244 [Dendrolimus kikuchii]|uniref:Uncharacterized protein n=1 Tax=Dendrolimus kikuchii TaxID=765133 RepID=A0ACC1D7K8_9NEOP|nr:hypothetical protein K1T71_005244 [Dendrolimus kikuchii]
MDAGFLPYFTKDMYIINHSNLRHSSISAGYGSCTSTGDENLTTQWSSEMDGVAETRVQLRTLLKVHMPLIAIECASSSMLHMTS